MNMYNPPSRANLRGRQRSDSSPDLIRHAFDTRRNSTPNLEQSGFYSNGIYASKKPGQLRTDSVGDGSSHSVQRSTTVQSGHDARLQRKSVGVSSQPASPSYRSKRSVNGMSGSTTANNSLDDSSITLHGLVEHSETDDEYYGRPLTRHGTPKASRRSQSPMKKMFGEGGWLTNSPNPGVSGSSSQRSPSPFKKLLGGQTRRGHSPKHDGARILKTADRAKKGGLMHKLKNKIDEIVSAWLYLTMLKLMKGKSEKAELNASAKRSEQHKHPKLVLLSISISAPEQARTLMELELMISHTANKFLLNEFCQSRVSVDTIKKVVDSWRNKGRPAVVEFMYDQATQRELISANQHNFRFHGSKASDPVRIASMLYTWKQATCIMSVRTFCSPDTVLLKLLFDVEQVLDFLGAPEAIMLRLQQIRTESNEAVRKARIGKVAREVPHHGEEARDSFTTTANSSFQQSFESDFRTSMHISDSDIEKTLL